MADIVQHDDPFALAQQQFDMVAERMHLDNGMRQMLRYPNRELTTTFPVLMDDGSSRVFTGYRVQPNLARGPTKGGIRYSPCVTLNEIRAEEVGCRLMAVSDSQGGLYNPQGLCTTDLLAGKQAKGSVQHGGVGERLSNTEVLELPCDILVPAALEHQLTVSNATRLQTKLTVLWLTSPPLPYTGRDARVEWISCGGVKLNVFMDVSYQLTSKYTEKTPERLYTHFG